MLQKNKSKKQMSNGIICKDMTVTFLVPKCYIGHMKGNIDKWLQIKREYLAGTSIKDIAEKFDVSYGALRVRVSREKWNKAKATVNQRAINKIAEKHIEEVVDNFTSISNATTEAIAVTKRKLDILKKEPDPDVNEIKGLVIALEKLQNMIFSSDDRIKGTTTEQEGLKYIVPTEESKGEAAEWIE